MVSHAFRDARDAAHGDAAESALLALQRTWLAAREAACLDIATSVPPTT
jgi:uncharacterized protein YecT (DUF1311 family)